MSHTGAAVAFELATTFLPACQFWLEYLKAPTFGGQYAWAPCLSSWPRNRGNLTDYYNEFCWWWGWQQQANKPPIIAEGDTSYLPYSGLSDAEKRRYYAMQANLPYDCMGECSAAASSLDTMSTCVGGLSQLQCAPVLLMLCPQCIVV